MKTVRGLSRKRFDEQFGSNEQCLLYLSNEKWGDLYKAFGMVYEIMTNKKGANSMRLGELFEVSQNTAWLFRRKVQDYLKSSGKHKLTKLVHVDEFEIGTPKTGKQGRAKTDKR